MIRDSLYKKNTRISIFLAYTIMIIFISISNFR